MANRRKSKTNTNYEVIYEDRDVIVVNKPVGLLCVPIPKSKAVNLLDILRNDMRHKTKEFHIVHRIDRFTSGAVVFAKNKKARHHLIKQFLAHEPKRTYMALVRGVVEKDQDTLVHYLKKIEKGFRNVVADKNDEGSAMARMRYQVLEHFADTTLLSVELDTGLKNQIRVQLEAIGHPIVGDRHYHPSEKKEKLINRQALHAWKLVFVQPASGEEVHCEASLPPDMQNVINFYSQKD